MRARTKLHAPWASLLLRLAQPCHSTPSLLHPLWGGDHQILNQPRLEETLKDHLVQAQPLDKII